MKPETTATVEVDSDEPAWMLMRQIQRCRALVLLELQDDPNMRDITLRQVSGGEVTVARKALEAAAKKERDRIAWTFIQHIDRLDCNGKDKKLSKILHAVLEEIKSDVQTRSE